jgi:thioredoxin-like negative regulator of GroEL
MDVDKNKEFAASLGVRAIPTVKLFSGGKEVHTQSGIQMEPQIKQLINNLING